MIHVTRSSEPIGPPGAAGGYPECPTLPFMSVRCRHGDAELACGGDDLACVVLILSEGQVVERKTRGVWSHRPSRSGLITVIDPDEVTEFTIRGQADVVRFFIPMAGLAEASGLVRRPNVKARFIESEPELERCAQRAMVALHKGAGSDPLLLSSIAASFSRTVIEQPSRPAGRAVGGISRWQLRRVEELIDSRLSAPIASSPRLSELAAEANLSVYHFAREFRRTLGVSPYSYMLRRRLEQARWHVINTRLPIARIGVLSGFPSAAHFADRFHRGMGVSPGALRRAVQA